MKRVRAARIIALWLLATAATTSYGQTTQSCRACAPQRNYRTGLSGSISIGLASEFSDYDVYLATAE